MYYTERKPKNKKRGRSGNKANSVLVPTLHMHGCHYSACAVNWATNQATNRATNQVTNRAMNHESKWYSQQWQIVFIESECHTYLNAALLYVFHKKKTTTTIEISANSLNWHTFFLRFSSAANFTGAILAHKGCVIQLLCQCANGEISTALL